MPVLTVIVVSFVVFMFVALMAALAGAQLWCALDPKARTSAKAAPAELRKAA